MAINILLSGHFGISKHCVRCNKSESDSGADDEADAWNNIQQVHLPHNNRERGPSQYRIIGLCWFNTNAYGNETVLSWGGVNSYVDPK